MVKVRTSAAGRISRKTKIDNRVALAATAALVSSAGIFAGKASATAYNWSRGIGNSGTGFSWIDAPTGTEDAGASNWGVAGAYPSVAGDVANIYNATSANQTINLDANISIGTLNMGNSTGYQNVRNISSGAGGAYTLTFNNLTADGIITQSSINSSGNITSPIIISGDGNIDLTNTSTGYMNLSGGITSALTSGTQNLNFQSGIYNVNGAIGNGAAGGTVAINVSGGTTTLNSAAANSYTGATSINSGTLSGALIEDFANATSPTNLISSSSALILGGGSLTVKAQNNVVTSQTFNGLTLNPGVGRIVGTNTGTGSLTLALGNITQNVGGAVDFTLPASGVITTTAVSTNGIIGGFATIGGNSNIATGDFATTNSSGGIILPTYTAISAAAASSQTGVGASAQNWVAGFATVNSTNEVTTLTASATINSLIVQGDFSVNSGVLMTLGSGGLILRGQSRYVLNNGAGSSAGTGQITSGYSVGTTGQLFVDVPTTAADNWTIWPSIVNNPTTGNPLELIKTGAALLELGDTNTFTGNLEIAAGSVEGIATNSFGTSLTNTVLMAPGTILNNDANNTIATITNLVGGPTGGSVALTAGTLSIGSTNLSTAIPTVISGAGALTKIGTGTLTLSAANTYTGYTTVNGGIVNVTAGSLTGLTSNGIVLGGVANSSGVMYQATGTTVGLTTPENQLKIGDAVGAYGYYQLAGGTLNVQEVDLGGIDGAGTGVLDMSGGTMTVSGWFLPNRAASSTAILNMSGGTATFTGSNSRFEMNWGTTTATAQSVLNFGGGPTTATFNASGAIFNPMGAGGTTTVAGTLGATNLLTNGILQVDAIVPLSATGTSLVNFEGGTLKAGVNTSTPFLTSPNLTGIYVYSAGGTIDNNGLSIAISNPLLSPAGVGGSNQGVSAITVTSGGSGYIGAPAVTLSGGNGVGATAVAVVTNGVLTGITITNPGTGYTGAPNVTLTGGGTTNPASTPSVTISTAADASGGLTFAGVGTTTLSGLSTYTGATNISTATVVAGVSSTSAGGAVGISSAVILGNVATAGLNLNGFNVSIGSLTGGGTTGGNLALGAGTLTVGSDGTSPAAYAGIISGTGGITQVGGGLKLSGINSYSGVTNINAGTLTIMPTGGIGGTAVSVVNVASGAALTVQSGGAISSSTNLSNSGIATFNNSTTTLAYLNGGSTGVVNTNGNNITVNSGGTFAGAINDGSTAGGSLTLTNGTLTLQGANLFTGATSITGGTLTVDHSGLNLGSLSNTPVTVASGANLVVKGTTSIGSNSTATLSSAGTISLQDLTINTLTVGGALSLSNDTVKIDLGGNGSTGSADKIVSGTTSGDVANLSTANPTTISLDLLAGQTVTNGNYTLISDAAGGLYSAGGSSGDAFFVLGSKPAGFNNYSFANSTSTALVLTITGNSVVSGSEYWTGAASRSISDSHNNWADSASSSTVSNWATNLAGTADPAQVPGSTTDVIFTASNANGVSGVLTTQMDSGYSIKGLTFNVPSTTALTSAIIGTNANALTIGTDGLTLALTSNASGTISGSGSVIVNGNQNWANNSSLPLTISSGISAVNSGTVLTLNGTGAGGVTLGALTNGTGGLGLTVSQTGTTTLNGVDNVSGVLTVNSGTVIATGADTFGGLAVTGGSLTMNSSATFTGPATISTGTVSITGASSVTGGLTVNSGSATLTGASTITGGVSVTGGTLVLTGNNNISGGVSITGGLVQLGNSGSLNATTPNVLTFGSGGDLQLNGHNVTVNTLTGSAGSILENASASNSVLTDNIGSGSTTFGGLIQDGTGGGTMSIVATGTGVFALTGSNTYSGSTNVSGGATLQINASNNIGNGTAATNTITLNNATLESLGNTYSLTSAQAITLAGPGTIQSDGGGTLTVAGNIVVGTNTLTVNGTGSTNFSGSIGFNNGSGGLTVNSSGITTLNGSNGYTGSTIVTNGTLVISGGTTGTTGTAGLNNVQLAIASNQTATLDVTGGTLNADRVIIGGNTGNTDGGNATVLQSGGTINSAQWFTVGSGNNAGTAASVGVYNLSGGTLNVNSAGGTSLEVGNFGATSGTLDISGASYINMYNSGNINLLANGGLSGIVNQNGGNVTFYSDNGVTPGGTGSLVVGTYGTGNAYYILNAGTLSVPSVTRTGGIGTFKFNGGVLQAESSSATFVSNLSYAYVEGGGAIINVPAGLTPTIPEALLHDNSGGSSDGGLTVTGAGILTLTSTANTYAGNTQISGGTLRLAGSAAPILSYTFSPSTVSGNTVINTGYGGTLMNGTFYANGGTGSISTTGGPRANTGALNLNGDGSTLQVSSGVTTMNSTGNWTLSAWVETSQAGFTIVNKGTANTGWGSGNTSFYLGVTGATSGSGGVPTAVRYAGGWMSGAAAPTVIDGTWHMLTYTDTGSNEVIYIDGVAEATAQGLTNTDVGSLLRFGLPGIGENGDGNVVSTGSISDVNIYSTGLTASQVQSLYTTNAVNSSNSAANTSNILPSGTPVSLTSNTSVLDMEGENQTVASLSGVLGSSLVLGNGSMLTINNTTNSEFDGSVTGSGGINLPNAGVFNLGSGAITISGPTVVGSGSVLNIGNNSSGGIVTRTLGTLTIQGGTVALAHAGTHATRQLLTTTGLSLSGGTGSWSGLLDLSDNDMVVQGAGAIGLATITNQIQQGYNGGNWQGSGGITSSAAASRTSHLTALGVIQNDNGAGTGTALYSTFDGTSVGDADVLVKYTYYGDTNLDGMVDGSDYSRIDNGALNGLTGWFNGDFNYDGVINGSDYTLIDNAYNTQGASLAAEIGSPLAAATAQIAGSAAVPEPTTLSLLGICAAGLLGRRRRQRGV